ncbi:MAG: hypothetical protein M0Q26_11025 [Chitinophagaceae bacterium]|nr:hypothetical protein [Chitinophagaceae bacterium]
MQSSFQNLISMKAHLLFLHQQDSFDDVELVKELRTHPLHIYLICKTPCIRLDNSKTKITDDKICLTFYTTIGGVRKDIPIETVNNKSYLIGKIESEYPYNIVKAFKPDGSEHSVAKTHLLLKYLAAQQNMYLDEFDLEVLYVGQAFGKNGSRITVDRLKTHEKAQQIYFDTQQKFPDYEVWFLALTFEPLLMTMFKPWGDVDPSLFEADLEKQQKLEETPLSFDQQITIAEAALIRYFNTYQYNKEYLNFPLPEHGSYDELYNLDFNSAGIEVTTESIYTKLWSKDAAPSFYHYRSYFLHNNTDRKAMLKWFEK